jgi:O-antigen/teichoic acid export membrane protein
MKSRPVQLLNEFLAKGHERSVRAKKNIISSLFIKGFSIAISLVFLPITLNYVDSSVYGVWLTLSSIVGWFVFFDIGLTQGLRNKFAEAVARGDSELAQIYVSTTYAILAIIFLFLWVVFIITNSYLNWSSILNVDEGMRPEVTRLAIIVFTYFCLSFVLRIITTILIADQQPAKSSFIDLAGQALSLLFIIILVKTTEGSLIRLGLAYFVFHHCLSSWLRTCSFSGASMQNTDHRSGRSGLSMQESCLVWVWSFLLFRLQTSSSTRPLILLLHGIFPLPMLHHTMWFISISV